MNKLIYVIPTAIIFSLAIGFSYESQTAQASHAAPFLAIVKAVVQFEHTADLNTVTNYYINTVKPQAVTIIGTYSSNVDNFETEYRPDNEVLYIIGVNEGTGDNIYELYPKVAFYGNLPDGVTQAQFDNAFDNFITDLKNMVKSELQSNGATNIKAHVHYTTGSIDE